MPYLRVQPDTYTLKPKQLYDFPKCQFCGCEDFRLQRYNSKRNYESQRGYMAYVLWRRSCSGCGKTTALVKSNLD